MVEIARAIRGKQTYGPSVQVKTSLKPHERTSASLSFVDLDMIAIYGWQYAVVAC